MILSKLDFITPLRSQLWLNQRMDLFTSSEMFHAQLASSCYFWIYLLGQHKSREIAVAHSMRVLCISPVSQFPFCGSVRLSLLAKNVCAQAFLFIHMLLITSDYFTEPLESCVTAPYFVAYPLDAAIFITCFSSVLQLSNCSPLSNLFTTCSGTGSWTVGNEFQLFLQLQSAYLLRSIPVHRR